MNEIIVGTLFSLTLWLPSPAQASIDSLRVHSLKEGRIEFFALGRPSMLKIHGDSHSMSGHLDREKNKFSGAFEIPMSTFDTGMKIRNDHLLDRIFEAKKFERAKLKIVELQLPAGHPEGSENIPFTGRLNFHGVEHEIKGLADLDFKDQKPRFEARFDLDLTDFDIQPPEFMGMRVENRVRISARGEVLP